MTYLELPFASTVALAFNAADLQVDSSSRWERRFIGRLIRTYTCNLPNQVSTKLSKREIEEIQKIVGAGLYINVSDFVRDAVRRRLQELKAVSLDPPNMVQQRVYEYFKSRGGSAWPDEAAVELDYSVLEVLEALEQLRKKGKAWEVRPVSITEGAKS